MDKKKRKKKRIAIEGFENLLQSYTYSLMHPYVAVPYFVLIIITYYLIYLIYLFIFPFFSDFNECSLNNAGCEHVCNNTGGSFNCDCRAGFKLKPDKRGCAGHKIYSLHQLTAACRYLLQMR